jgi:hypothetical protein
MGILLWARSLLEPFSYQFYPGENKNILFAPIYNLLEGHFFLQVLISLVLVIFTGFLIQQVNDRFGFIRVRTKLPATLFVIFVGGFINMHTLHPVFFAGVFLIFAIHSLLAVFDNPNTFPQVFNAGFFIGIGSLFYFNLIILLPAFLIAIIILHRDYHWREFVIMLIGSIVPFIFAASYAYLTDQLLEFLYTFEQDIITPVNHFRTNYVLQGFLGFLIILTIIGSIKILQQYDTRKVSSRKYYLVFLFIFAFSLLSFMFIPAVSQEMLVITIIPITFLTTNMFVSITSRFWSELLFTLLLLIVFFVQISDNFIHG